MIYTIVGFFGGMLVGKLIAMIQGESTLHRSQGEITMMICALIGAGVGFGVGSSHLIAGTHIVQTIVK